MKLSKAFLLLSSLSLANFAWAQETCTHTITCPTKIENLKVNTSGNIIVTPENDWSVRNCATATGANRDITLEGGAAGYGRMHAALLTAETLDLEILIRIIPNNSSECILSYVHTGPFN